MSPSLVKKIVPGPRSESLVDSNIETEEMVCSMLHKTFPQLDVIEVYTVKNSFLEAMYLLKKEEYKSRYGKAPKEMHLFHVTAASNVDSIVSNNFDWRRTTRGKFGLGTSFSGDAAYANRYANFNIGSRRALIVTKVLMSSKTCGHEGMEMPPEFQDTAIGHGDKVYVKFCDNEMLPEHIVLYNCNAKGLHLYRKFSSSVRPTHISRYDQSAATSGGSNQCHKFERSNVHNHSDPQNQEMAFYKIIALMLLFCYFYLSFHYG